MYEFEHAFPSYLKFIIGRTQHPDDDEVVQIMVTKHIAPAKIHTSFKN